MKFLLPLLLVISSFAHAALPVVSYKNIQCRYFVDEKLVKEHSQALMTLMIDDRMGRFAQIQFGDAQNKVQYQVLIEDDLKVNGAVLVLQNLLVDTLESSSEFSAKEVTWVRLSQGSHNVSCDLK